MGTSEERLAALQALAALVGGGSGKTRAFEAEKVTLDLTSSAELDRLMEVAKQAMGVLPLTKDADGSRGFVIGTTHLCNILDHLLHKIISREGSPHEALHMAFYLGMGVATDFNLTKEQFPKPLDPEALLPEGTKVILHSVDPAHPSSFEGLESEILEVDPEDPILPYCLDMEDGRPLWVRFDQVTKAQEET